MIKASKALLEKLFDIREGEIFRAFSMQLNIFLIITTLLVLKPTVNSLFLSRFGVESLPTAFILVAITAGLVITLYSRIVYYIRFNFLIIGTLVFSVLILIFLGLALRIGFLGDWILYVFYIWVAIFALLTASQFWLLSNIVFNDREAKRLVGFIGAGAIAGSIFGGYLTSILTQFMDSVNLPFVAAFFIGLCIPLTALIWQRVKKVQPLSSSQKTEVGQEHPYKTILKSRHLFLLASIVGVSNIVAKFVDYQFGGIASKLITDPDQLTAFFGFWFSTFNVISLLVQLIATRFLVKRYGVGISLLILPAAICIATLFLLIAPELLIAVILLKMADGSLKQSVNKSAMELLYFPIDIRDKNKAKPFIDVFIDSLATGISGIILIFVVNGLSLSTGTINLLILTFIAFWIFLVIEIRKEYLHSFKIKILNNIKSGSLFTSHIRKGSIIRWLKKVFSSGSKEQILNAFARIRNIKDKELFEVVAQLLTHPSEEVRIEAIQNLYHFKNIEIYKKVKKMTGDDSPKVKSAALSYLIEHTPIKNKKIIDHHLESSDEKLSGLALISLAIELQNNPKLQRRYKLMEKILAKLEAINNEPNAHKQYLQKIYCIQAIGHANIQELHQHLRIFFKDRNPGVVRQAMLSAGKTKNETFVHDLLRLHSKPAYRRTAHKALQNYKNEIVDIMDRSARRNPDEIALLRKFPAIIKQVGSQKSIKLLFKLLDHNDPEIRQESLFGLTDLRSNFPRLRFKKKKVLVQILEEVVMCQKVIVFLHVQLRKKTNEEEEVRKARKRVVTLLRTQINRNLENILRLLSLNYATENISVVAKGFKSRKHKVRITALEFLDNLLDPGLKRNVTPLFEVSIMDLSKRSTIGKMDVEIPDEISCCSSILKMPGKIRLKIATLHLIHKLRDPEYIPLVQACIHTNDPELKVYAETVLEDLNRQARILKVRS